MKILFLGDVTHPNAKSWIDALRTFGDCEVITYSLTDRRSKMFGRIARLIEWIMSISNIRRLVKQEKPDVVIAYRSTSYGFLGVRSGFHPLVVAMQGATDVWPLHGLSVPLKKRLARYAFTHADMVQAWGSHMMHNAVKLGADPNKVMVLPRGINSSLFHRPDKPAPLDKLRIIVTRSLFPEYRHTVILQAAADLKRKGREVRLHIVGKGALQETLEEEAKSLGLGSDVQFYGAMDHSDLAKLLRSCNIYVSMPLSEGVSASLFEAMGSGCFPIVSDLEANRSWIDDHVNGILVPIDDVQRLSDAMAYVQDNPAFYEAALDKNQRLVEEKATVQTNIRRFVAKYKELIRATTKSQ
jgi:glycosyltransferase involved in cell wall biosynthesis